MKRRKERRIMRLTLNRTALRDTYTIGHLYVNDVYECDTIEDKVRPEGEKVYGETAIPYGTYVVRMDIQSPKYSQRSQYNRCHGYLPRLMDVPNFDGVLIHIGNTADDSCGCILVGYNKEVGKVINSTDAFWKLYDKLAKAYANKEQITITIQ